jgi:hypothetical protein
MNMFHRNAEKPSTQRKALSFCEARWANLKAPQIFLREFLCAIRAFAFRFRPQTKSLAVTHDDPTHTDIVAEALEGGFIKPQ